MMGTHWCDGENRAGGDRLCYLGLIWGFYHFWQAAHVYGEVVALPCTGEGLTGVGQSWSGL